MPRGWFFERGRTNGCHKTRNGWYLGLVAPISSNSQAPVQKRDTTPNDNATSLDDVFMPEDDAINSSDGEIEEIDHKLEEFKRFCLLTKPLENHPNITLPFRPNIHSKTDVSYFDADFTREAPQLTPPDTHDPMSLMPNDVTT